MSSIIYELEDIMLNADNMVDVKPTNQQGFIIVRVSDNQQVAFRLSTTNEIKTTWTKKGLAQNAFFSHTDITYNDQSFFEIIEIK